ncbi:auxin response factor 2-like isoform X2 [Olea europaea subsp. europaea]|uniref:Auxin response factor 2-like isoform X2 n=1 Tax=Olea europaea subsp. europaea TaxID=158383 RepID=A0A8S0QXS5_OLEEU|nr:auxin response factor 2-like isoform X2 [Olea europaea subsp. europaea]
MANVPRVGDKVFYLPQDYIEQVDAYKSKDSGVPMLVYNVPDEILWYVGLLLSSHIEQVEACMSKDSDMPMPVADPNTDEAIAHITLVPKDMSRHLPSQDLVVKDLHETEWQFRHINRQPKCLLLGSGWSSFLNSKKLVARDTCIFFRGKTSKLFVGVAVQTWKAIC